MKSRKLKKEVVIYQARSGAIELRGDFGRETVWAIRISNYFQNGNSSK